MLWYKTLLISSPALKGAVVGYLEIVCLGQVQPLKAGQVRPIAKLAPHLHKIVAIIF